MFEELGRTQGLRRSNAPLSSRIDPEVSCAGREMDNSSANLAKLVCLASRWLVSGRAPFGFGTCSTLAWRLQR
jgi:hypothetical protein